MKKILLIFVITIFTNLKLMAMENKILIKLDYGTVEIELFNDSAPKHVERILTLYKNKEYDGVVFHRVIEGFMAQTGDVKFGNSKKYKCNLDMARTGASTLPDLKSEFSNIPHERGTVSMARSSNLIVVIANFICLSSTPFR